MKSRAFHLAILVTAAVLATAGDAKACACCDGYTNRKILGWSQTGTGALVDVDKNEGCETTRFLEVWEVGRRNPAGCFDLFADPDKRIKCDDVAAPEDFEAKSGKSRAIRQYPLPVRMLDARYLKGTLAPAKAARLDDGLVVASLTIEVFAAGEWRTVLRRKVNAGAGETMYPQVTLFVYPAPDNRHGLLTVEGNDSNPGIGHLATELHLIDLSEALPPSATRTANELSAPNDRSLPVYAIPALAAKKTELSRFAVKENARGMALHRQGSYAAAADRFSNAILLDPAHVMARYNLACAFVRLNHLEKAISLLREIRDAKCPTCAEILKRAANDEDLAALRSRDDFRRLTE